MTFPKFLSSKVASFMADTINISKEAAAHVYDPILDVESLAYHPQLYWPDYNYRSGYSLPMIPHPSLMDLNVLNTQFNSITHWEQLAEDCNVLFCFILASAPTVGSSELPPAHTLMIETSMWSGRRKRYHKQSMPSLSLDFVLITWNLQKGWTSIPK